MNRLLLILLGWGGGLGAPQAGAAAYNPNNFMLRWTPLQWTNFVRATAGTNGGGIVPTQWPYVAITNAPWQWGTVNGTNWSQLATNILSRYAVLTNLVWQTNVVLTRLFTYAVTNTFSSRFDATLPDYAVELYQHTPTEDGWYQVLFDIHYYYWYDGFVLSWKNWDYRVEASWQGPGGQPLTALLNEWQTAPLVYEVPLTTYYQKESGSFHLQAPAGSALVISNLITDFGDLEVTNYLYLTVARFTTNRFLTSVTP